MSGLFHEALYRPLLNLLVWLYGGIAFKDLGLAIVLVTIVVRLILFPLFYKGFKSQTVLQRLQPHIKKIQEQHKNDRERQGRALLDLYREHRVNPFSSFFLLLIQAPILIALYRVFLNKFSPEIFTDLYSFIPHPESFNTIFLGLIELRERSILMVALAALIQYWQGALSVSRTKTPGSDTSPAERMSRKMVFIGPIITVFFLISLPSAVALYWLVSTLFSVGQQLLINQTLRRRQEIHGTETPRTSEYPHQTDRSQ